jgi:hypothetical protein
MSARNGQLVPRHYCSHCDRRVYPFDTFEAATEAPIKGVSGERVMLYSLNSQRLAAARKLGERPVRIAWCWECDNWVETYQQTRHDELLRYLRRRGVVFRLDGNRIEHRAEGLELRMEARRR